MLKEGGNQATDRAADTPAAGPVWVTRSDRRFFGERPRGGLSVIIPVRGPARRRIKTERARRQEESDEWPNSDDAEENDAQALHMPRELVRWKRGPFYSAQQ